jgi:hypothetical protein
MHYLYFPYSSDQYAKYEFAMFNTCSIASIVAIDFL